MTNFVGVDLHRNNFTYCIRVNGEERKIGKCEITELKGCAAMLGPNTAMAVEATGNTFMFCSSVEQTDSQTTKSMPQPPMRAKDTEFKEEKIEIPEVGSEELFQLAINKINQRRWYDK